MQRVQKSRYLDEICTISGEFRRFLENRKICPKTAFLRPNSHNFVQICSVLGVMPCRECRNRVIWTRFARFLVNFVDFWKIEKFSKKTVFLPPNWHNFVQIWSVLGVMSCRKCKNHVIWTRFARFLINFVDF